MSVSLTRARMMYTDSQAICNWYTSCRQTAGERLPSPSPHPPPHPTLLPKKTTCVAMEQQTKPNQGPGRGVAELGAENAIPRMPEAVGHSHGIRCLLPGSTPPPPPLGRCISAEMLPGQGRRQASGAVSQRGNWDQTTCHHPENYAAPLFPAQSGRPGPNLMLHGLWIWLEGPCLWSRGLVAPLHAPENQRTVSPSMTKPD